MALRDLLKDSAKNNGSKQTGGSMERIRVDSTTSQIQEAESNGALVQGEEAELSQGPRTTEKDGQEVVELGKFEGDESLSTDNMPDTISLDSASMGRSALFTEAEKNAIEELEAEERLSDSDKESIQKVEEALDDPSMPNTRQGLLTQAAREEGKFGLSEEEFEDKQDKIRSELQDRDWIEESPEEKQVSEMTGEEFGEIIQKNMGGTEEAEMERNPEIEEEEEELSVPEISEEVAEQAASEWSQRGGVWEEFAQDMKNHTQIPNTHVTSIAPDRKQIVTSYDKLKSEIESLEDAEILEKDGDVLIAEVPAREEF
ncbi:hypothetical protein [Halolamina sp. C58]|uniref:hypothetical protein n=1 Tax=Halolamina sp. C58 TaxID=3421640 RepID=UPI003EB70336